MPPGEHGRSCQRLFAPLARTYVACLRSTVNMINSPERQRSDISFTLFVPPALHRRHILDEEPEEYRSDEKDKNRERSARQTGRKSHGSVQGTAVRLRWMT